MADAVLDASALLAYVLGESGAELVADRIRESLISAVNYAEVVGKLVERGGSLDVALGVLGIADIDVVDFDRELAERVGALVAVTRSKGLSLGDRACLAPAAREGLPVLTADRAWADIDLRIEIRLIR